MRTTQDARMPGWFWLPDDADSRVPGILTWTQADGGNLELIGGLGPAHSTDTPMPALIDYTTIYGETTDGKAVTLWEAQSGNRRKKCGRWIEQFWDARWVVVGSHLPSLTHTFLREVIAHVDNLYYLTGDGRICAPVWTREIPGVDEPVIAQPDGTRLYPWMLGVAGGYRASLGEGTLAGLRYRVSTTATRPWISEATEAYPDLKLDMMTTRDRRGRSVQVAVTASAHVEATQEESLSAENLLTALAPVLNLVGLATFERPGLGSITAVTTDGKNLDILCHSGYPASPDASPGAATRPVFTFDDLSLEEFLKFWAESTKTPQARYALNVALGIIGHHPHFVEEGLSQTFAAAEGFHAWCLDGGHKLPLKKRLKCLHDELPEAIRGRLNLATDTWADWGKWARNHVDHAGAKQHRDLTALQMDHLSDSVTLILYLRMLTEMGVSEARMLTALTDHKRLSRLSHVTSHLDLPNHPPQD